MGHLADVAGKAGLVLVAFAAVVAVVVTTARWIARHPEQIGAAVDARLAHPAVRRLGRRYARPLTFLADRLHPGRALGLALTVQVGILAAAGWAFGAILGDVIAGESNRFDAPVVRWFIAHREPWLTSTLRLVTQLGQTGVLLPVIVAVGVVLHHRRGTWAPLGLLGSAEAGAVGLYDLIKPLVGRPRPTLGPLVSTASGYSFPSGHATQAVAVYGALVIVCARGTTPVSRRAGAWAAATVATLLVGSSRVYLGVHWPSDVLAGWALGACWLAALLASIRVMNTRRLPGEDSPTGVPQ